VNRTNKYNELPRALAGCLACRVSGWRTENPFNGGGRESMSEYLVVERVRYAVGWLLLFASRLEIIDGIS